MRYAVVDIETTGLSRYAHRITEIAAVRVADGAVASRFSTLVNPGTHIPSFITRLTGIDDRMVKDAPRIEEAMPGFLRFMGEDLLVAHNAAFDHGFLHQNALQLGRPFLNERLCTRRLASRLLPDLPSKRLSACCEHFRIDNAQAHRAMGDALATHELFLRLQALMRQQGIKEEEYASFAARPRRLAPTRDMCCSPTSRTVSGRSC